MSANGAKNGSILSQEDLFKISQKGNKALCLLGEESRMGLVSELDKAFQAYKDGIPFKVSILMPKTFGEFLDFSKKTLSLFNQLVSEVRDWQLINQIEESCFLQDSAIEKSRFFIANLWKDKIATDSFKPPANWKYLPVSEAVEEFKKIFGSSLKANSVLRLAKQAKSHKQSEGIPVWMKLSFLFRYFEIPKFLGISEKVRPWDNTEEGRVAYANVVKLFIPEVEKAYTKAYPSYSFKNWRKDQLTSEYILLTPACRKTWAILEQMSDDDFVIAPGGANTGSIYAGHTVLLSRLRIVLAITQFSQDCIMAGATVAIQQDRLTKCEHLGIDCPGNQCSSFAGGDFPLCVYFGWSDGGLHFSDNWIGRIGQGFGSASGRLAL